MGFEPTTLGTTIRCSNLLSYDVRLKEQGTKIKFIFKKLKTEKSSRLYFFRTAKANSRRILTFD